MIIMLFGISSVGKTATGDKLANKLKYTFVDLDEEIKKKCKMTLEDFIRNNPYPHGRYKIKGAILKELIEEYKDNFVVAVSPIYYARNFNSLIELEGVIAIELQDMEEHIFERMVFSDENDNVYYDDEYKEKHKKHYIRDIRNDIVGAKTAFKKIENKYFINNQSVDKVVDELIIMIRDISVDKWFKIT